MHIQLMMNDTIFAELFSESEKRKRDIQQYPKKRPLYFELREKKNSHIGIYGLRGTGKTTILLQLAADREDSIYVSMENLVFKGASLIEFVEFADKKGFRSFFIDEIHTHLNWARELKLLYDGGIKNVFFSGSSSLKIQEQAADLSRRALLFGLSPLSFREFLGMNLNVEIEKPSFVELLDFGRRKELITSIAPHISHFDEYMRFGSFPTYMDQKADAYSIYKRMIDKIVRVDMAAISKIDVTYIESVYKIINTIAISNPNEMTLSSLSKQINKNAYVAQEIIRNLTEIGFVNSIRPYKKGGSIVRKEQKMLLSPPFRLTLAKSLGFGFEHVIGGIREDFFVMATSQNNPFYVKTDRERKTPDFAINGMTFELGPHKYKHGTDFYVKDQLIIQENVIPLPLFCLLS